MDNELKTVGGVAEDINNPSEVPSTVTQPAVLAESQMVEASGLTTVDPLLKEQQNQVGQMRSTLLSFNPNDLNSAKRALQNITVMRIYHQIARIIRFTEQMDRLEDKLYDSIDMSISGLDSADPTTMLMLLKVQAQLQDTMIQSQQLLKPYLDMDIEAIAPPQELEETSFGATIISQESRNNIRTGAQALLTELRKTNPGLPQEEQPPQEASKNTTEANANNVGEVPNDRNACEE